MKPYGSKRSFDTDPRIKSARALVKREGESLIEEQTPPQCPRCSKVECPASKDWHESCAADDETFGD